MENTLLYSSKDNRKIIHLASVFCVSPVSSLILAAVLQRSLPLFGRQGTQAEGLVVCKGLGHETAVCHDLNIFSGGPDSEFCSCPIMAYSLHISHVLSERPEK